MTNSMFILILLLLLQVPVPSVDISARMGSASLGAQSVMETMTVETTVMKPAVEAVS